MVHTEVVKVRYFAEIDRDAFYKRYQKQFQPEQPYVHRRSIAWAGLNHRHTYVRHVHEIG